MTYEFELASLTRGPWATLVWGSPRPLVNHVLYALGRANDPEVYWLELRERENDPQDTGPARHGWIPEDRFFFTANLEKAKPQDGVANLALASLVRSDEPEQSILRLADFVRLPDVAQEIISRLGAGDHPRVIVIANSDRVRDAFPSSAAGVRPVFDAFLHSNLHPFFSVVGEPTERRFASDFVIEARVPDPGDWESGSLVVEKAPENSGIRPGLSVPFSRVPGLASQFRGIRPDP